MTHMCLFYTADAKHVTLYLRNMSLGFYCSIILQTHTRTHTNNTHIRMDMRKSLKQTKKKVVFFWYQHKSRKQDLYNCLPNPSSTENGMLNIYEFISIQYNDHGNLPHTHNPAIWKKKKTFSFDTSASFFLLPQQKSDNNRLIKFTDENVIKNFFISSSSLSPTRHAMKIGIEFICQSLSLSLI